MRTLLGIATGGPSPKSTYRIRGADELELVPNAKVRLGLFPYHHLPEASSKAPTPDRDQRPNDRVGVDPIDEKRPSKLGRLSMWKKSILLFMTMVVWKA